MTDTFGNIFSGIGLFLCIGGILLVVLVFMAIRALTGPRPPASPTIWNQRGSEEPTYDEPDINTTGGFGGTIPSTGRDQDDDLGGFGPPDERPQQGSAGFGSPPATRRSKDDDPDIRSSGGFGGS